MTPPKTGSTAAVWERPDRLVPWERNPRFNDGEPVAAVKASIMGGELARAVWTDPPYGVAIVGGSHALSPEERLARGGKTIQNDALSPDD